MIFVESGTGRFANIQVLGMAQYLCYIFCVPDDNFLINNKNRLFVTVNLNCISEHCTVLQNTDSNYANNKG